VILIFALAFARKLFVSVFEPVTIASAVPDSVTPAVMIEVADVITVSRAAAAVTVIVNVCAVAPCSAPEVPIVAGVSLTT
jgi:putative effector of murein hydrolase